jgi:outer membrane protein OmpA-like peptidoglycan-associated protein
MSFVPPKRRTGAVRTEEPRRKKRGLLWLLLALLGLILLIAIAVSLYFALRGSDKPSQANPTASASTPSPAAASASGPATPSAAASTGSAGAGTGTVKAGSSGGLVGGSGVTAAAAGSIPGGARLAAPGTVGTVLFAENSAVVDPQGQQVVAAAVRALHASGARAVQVTGYTDVVGGQPVNGSLSQQRADRVAAALRQQLGSAVPVSTAARGENDPVAPNDTDAHRRLNRRATITTR